MERVNNQHIVDSLGRAISERNKDKTLYSVIDFLMAYLPDSSRPSEIDATRNVLHSDFGLNKGTFIGVARSRQTGIYALLDYFDGDIESNSDDCRTYELSFLGGGPGYGKLVFDRHTNTVMLPPAVRGWPELHGRFLLAYGADSVHLDIPNNKFYVGADKLDSRSENLSNRS